MSAIDAAPQYEDVAITRAELAAARATAPPLTMPAPRSVFAIPGELPWTGSRSEMDESREKRKEWDGRDRGEPPKHGTTYAYQVYRCRCSECREAKTAKQRERRARQKVLTTSPGSVIPRRDN